MTRTILVVDDEPGVASMIARMLDDAGYHVIVASDGKAAILELAQEFVDLIVTDIVMPEVEGIELVRHVKKKNPAVPIIAVSGGGRTRNLGFLEFARGLGADATLAKPFRREELLALVTRLLSSGDDQEST